MAKAQNMIEDAEILEDDYEEMEEDVAEYDLDEDVEDMVEDMEVPDGGIAQMIMTDEELDEVYPDDFPGMTERMAAMGREGDDVIAHLQTGEIVIPAKFVEDNPEMKEAIFEFLMENGIEDPERYVVGSGANSVHPETGAFEFFLGKIVKGIGKALKGVGKVLKKVAPIVLPIALSFTPLGAVYGAALGSGIGTLINGGSVGDALKSALLAGATGAAFSGFSGGGTFMENVGQSLADPFGRVGQTLQGASTSAQNIFGGEAARAANAGKQGFFSSYNPAAATGAEATMTKAAAPAGEAVSTPTATGAEGVATEVPGFWDSLKGAVTPGDNIGFMEGMQAAFFPNSVVPEGVTASAFRTYAPLAAAGAAGIGATYALGGFDEPEQDPVYHLRGTDLLEADPEKYRVTNLGPIQWSSEEGKYVTNYDYHDKMAELYPSIYGDYAAGPDVVAAKGGEIYPRRTGGISPREGVPNEDSVRALLMPGEFVMTTDAVKGAGNGDPDRGIKNMYSVMRNLERRGRAMS